MAERKGAERKGAERPAFDPVEERKRLLEVAFSSIEDSPPHMRAQLIAQARAIITELSPDPVAGQARIPGGESSGVVSFQEKLEARRANSKGKGRSRKSG